MSSPKSPTNLEAILGAEAAGADARPDDSGLEEFLDDLKRLATPPTQRFLDFFGPGAPSRHHHQV